MNRKEFLGRSLPVVAGVGLGCPCVLAADQDTAAPAPAVAPGHAGATTFGK
jgi:hypothetical protein